jgi:hypothetical protein
MKTVANQAVMARSIHVPGRRGEAGPNVTQAAQLKLVFLSAFARPPSVTHGDSPAGFKALKGHREIGQGKRSATLGSARSADVP